MKRRNLNSVGLDGFAIALFCFVWALAPVKVEEVKGGSRVRGSCVHLGAETHVHSIPGPRLG